MSGPTAQLLESLQFTDGELVSVCSTTPAGEFRVLGILPVRDVPAVVAAVADRDCWIGANPLRAGITTGRGSAVDVIGLRSIYADLDVKPGGLPSWAEARAVVDVISDMLGVQPAAVVMSGHGLQPRWLVERADGTDWASASDPAARNAMAISRRCGRLVQDVAEHHGGNVDSVHDLSRVLRAPGTTNRKSDPVQTTLELPGGAPVSLERILETLAEYGVPEFPEDREALDVEVSTPASWTYGSRTCPYVAAMVDGWATDKPTGRHPWLVGQAVRLAAAQRLGCVTEPDYRVAVGKLAARFRTRLNVGAKRKPAPGEISGALGWGRAKVAAFTDDRTADELGRHAHPGEPPKREFEPIDLAAVDQVFTRWLGAEYDLDVLHAVLAVTAAGIHLSGDPAWLLVVAGSGMTKTETVAPLAYAGAVLTSTIGSESSLLSGTSHKERVSTASGGLLRQVGDRGVLVLKDVTSILSANRDSRSQVLAALREVFDGRWDRPVGSDGGQMLTWTGRCIVVGAVTTAWDEAHAVISAMGDRFLLIRPPEDDARAAGVAALRVQGREEQMRDELGVAVGGLLQHVDAAAGDTPTPDRMILDLADLVTWSRTGVETDYRGDALGAHAREAPTRFAKELQALHRGARLIGLDDEAGRTLVVRVARDSMPPRRRAMLGALLQQNGPETTYALAGRACLPRTTADRHLQALQALRLATHHAAGKDTPWQWSLAPGLDRHALSVLCLPGYVWGESLSGQSAPSGSPSNSSHHTTLSTSYLEEDTPGRNLSERRMSA